MSQYGVIKQRAKNISREEYIRLKDLSYASKNLYNRALYIKRQNFFEIKAIRGSINRSRLDSDKKQLLLKRKDLRLMTYVELYHIIKKEAAYKALNANMSQQILKTVDESFKSFLGLLSKKKSKSYESRVNLPNYIRKDGFFSLIIAEFSIKNNRFTIPMARNQKEQIKISFNVPSILEDKKVKEIRVIPKQNARFFELHYVYEVEVSNGTYDKNNALAIDLGINNLMTCVTNLGQSFIIDGKYIKSINQYANKENARLKSILDKQGLKASEKLNRMWNKRTNIINDYVVKSCRYIVNYCKTNNIGSLVLGFNKDMTRYANLGSKNNQNLVSLPMGKIKESLRYMCHREGITLHLQEESYTSKSSFWDKDPIDKCHYSGKRIKRGLYKTSKGLLINSDINGALNILRKSKVVGLDALYRRGAVDTPLRIRVA